MTADGCAKAIKANYYKMGFRDFTHNMGGASDGFWATGVIEGYEEADTNEH